MHRVAARLVLLAALLLPACGSPTEEEPSAPPDAAPFDLAAFEAAMAGDDAALRAATLDALLGRVEIPSETVPTLATALADANRWVRDRAARALGRIGPDAARALPALIAALRDKDGFVRWRAAKALAQMGPVAAPALPELERMAAETSETELGRHWSAVAVEKIRADG